MIDVKAIPTIDEPNVEIKITDKNADEVIATGNFFTSTKDGADTNFLQVKEKLLASVTRRVNLARKTIAKKAATTAIATA